MVTPERVDHTRIVHSKTSTLHRHSERCRALRDQAGMGVAGEPLRGAILAPQRMQNLALRGLTWEKQRGERASASRTP